MYNKWLAIKVWFISGARRVNRSSLAKQECSAILNYDAADMHGRTCVPTDTTMSPHLAWRQVQDSKAASAPATVSTRLHQHELGYTVQYRQSQTDRQTSSLSCSNLHDCQALSSSYRLFQCLDCSASHIKSCDRCALHQHIICVSLPVTSGKRPALISVCLAMPRRRYSYITFIAVLSRGWQNWRLLPQHLIQYWLNNNYIDPVMSQAAGKHGYIKTEDRKIRRTKAGNWKCGTNSHNATLAVHKVIAIVNKKAVQSQGNRAMPQLLFSV